MEVLQIYFLISILVLLIIAISIFFVKKNKKEEPFTPLIGIAFGFILGGIIFGGGGLISYSLIGIGVVIAIIVMLLGNQRKNKKRKN